MTNLVRLAAEPVGVPYVPGEMYPFPPILPGVPLEKAGLSDRDILELPLDRGEAYPPEPFAPTPAAAGEN